MGTRQPPFLASRLLTSIVYRTKKDATLGHKIIDLPASKARDLWIAPQKEEEIFLRAVLVKCYDTAIEEWKAPEAENAVNDDAEADMDAEEVPSPTQDQDETLDSRVVFCLSQAISHPLNLESLFRTRFTPEEIRSLTKELSEQGGKLSRRITCGTTQRILVEFQTFKRG